MHSIVVEDTGDMDCLLVDPRVLIEDNKADEADAGITLYPDPKYSGLLHKDLSAGDAQGDIITDWVSATGCFAVTAKGVDFAKKLAWLKKSARIISASGTVLHVKNESVDYLEEAKAHIDSFMTCSWREIITSLSAVQFYIQKVKNLPNVRAILSEALPDSKHLLTVLNVRNLDTRERIYEIEMQMYDNYPNGKYTFSIKHIQDSHELHLFLKDKTALLVKS